MKTYQQIGAVFALSTAVGAGVYGFKELLPHEATSTYHNRQVDACAVQLDESETAVQRVPTDCLIFSSRFEQRTDRDATARRGVVASIVLPSRHEFVEENKWTAANDEVIRTNHRDEAILFSGLIALIGVGFVSYERRMLDRPDSPDPVFDAELHQLLNAES